MDEYLSDIQALHRSDTELRYELKWPSKPEDFRMLQRLKLGLQYGGDTYEDTTLMHAHAQTHTEMRSQPPSEL